MELDALKVLLVIHGYPMRYNAGSEVYTQSLARGLPKRHQVHVFTRQEDTFLPEYHMSDERDSADPSVALHVINIARGRDGYRRQEVDGQFGRLLDRLEPNVIHLGHLNHLSTSLVQEAHLRGIPMVFTLHDYWLMCPRGQFIQMFPENPKDVWAVCDGQEDRKCATKCYSRYFSGAPEELENDTNYWAHWVGERMAHVQAMCQLVDRFIAPSRYLLRRFRDEFGLPEEKLVYLDYGFPTTRLGGRRRVPDDPFTFAYIGTHIPAKGIHHLITAFGLLSGDPQLRIWGRQRGPETESLMNMTERLPGGLRQRVHWMGEYQNQDIVSEVFDRCDAIVVPSIWAENSPLVIHEAQQARVPVITANYGGMAEYVQHGENGLLFNHRDSRSLAQQMQLMVSNPGFAHGLGQRGYLQSTDGNVPDMGQHVRAVEELYAGLVKARS